MLSVDSLNLKALEAEAAGKDEIPPQVSAPVCEREREGWRERQIDRE